MPPSACCLPHIAWKESLCQVWQILQKFERNSEAMWKYGNSLEFRQFNHHRTWRVTCLFGWKVPHTTKKVQEADSGNVFLKCAFLCRVAFSCSLSPLQTFNALLRDRIVSRCYRQSCWHLLSFLSVRSIFCFLFLCRTSVHSEIFHNLYLPWHLTWEQNVASLLKSVFSVRYLCLAVIFYVKGKVPLVLLQAPNCCCTKVYKLSHL